MLKKNLPVAKINISVERSKEKSALLSAQNTMKTDPLRKPPDEHQPENRLWPWSTALKASSRSVLVD